LSVSAQASSGGDRRVPLPRLYLVTDRRATERPLPEVVAAALAGVPPGGAWVQLREKDLDGGALLALARALAPVVRARDGRLFVNDRLDVALAAGADGVHLPENGFDVATARRLAPGLLVGASTHTRAAAAASTADLVLLGPIYATPDKPAALGLDAVSPGAFAIGGITSPERAAACRAAGAAGIACIRAVLAAPDPAAAARALWEAAA
jgi:thiamine-phosphate pyrophosphorylase